MKTSIWRALWRNLFLILPFVCSAADREAIRADMRDAAARAAREKRQSQS